MTRFLLDIAYLLLLIAVSPMVIYRMIRFGRYREDLDQRFGRVPKRNGLQPTIWIHGVSLGEVNAACTLVEQLHSQLSDYRVVISSTTQTGINAARKRFEPDHLVFRWPLDFSFAVRNALKRIRPSLVVLMEGEIWPNFLSICNDRNVPVVVVNARLSRDKGYPGYKKLGSFAAKLFNRISAYGVQDESYAKRYLSLGVDRSRVHVTGMMKFDTAHVADRIDGQDELASELGVTQEQRLIVAGGTGPGEEELILDMFRDLREKHPDTRLAIVPRKPERFDDVAKLIRDSGFDLLRRSEMSTPSANTQNSVILGDTMGELRKFYALATCVFVGRSLVQMGGSDMIEAAALGKPTAFGPYTFNFPQADALAENGCVRVENATQLGKQFDAWLSAPDSAAQTGKAAREYVISQQGATRRNVEMICNVLNREPAMNQGDIATDKLRDQQTQESNHA